MLKIFLQDFPPTPAAHKIEGGARSTDSRLPCGRVRYVECREAKAARMVAEMACACVRQGEAHHLLSRAGAVAIAAVKLGGGLVAIYGRSHTVWYMIFVHRKWKPTTVKRGAWQWRLA